MIDYYIPCKARTYLNDLNEKNIITILKQFIKTKGYTIISREKYSNKKKFIIYQLIYNYIIVARAQKVNSFYQFFPLL